MNYIELVRQFWQCNNEIPIGPNATALYFYLLNVCNSLGWKETFRHSDRHISIQLGISVNTVRGAKNRLKQLGLIDFKSPEKKSKGLEGCTVYEILTVSKSDTVPDTVADTVPDTVADTVPDTRNKLNKTKLNITPDGVVDLWHSTCPSLGKIQKLTDGRKKKINCRLSEMGNDQVQLLKELFRKVDASVFLKGDNRNQWVATFDWLFENDKNWVKVIEGNYDNKAGKIEAIL